MKLIMPKSVWLDVSASPPNLPKQTFKLKVTHHSRQAGLDYVTRIGADARLDVDWIKEQVLDWSGVEDDDNKPIDFSDEAFDAALDIRWFFNAVRKAVFDELVTGGTTSKN